MGPGTVTNGSKVGPGTVTNGSGSRDGATNNEDTIGGAILGPSRAHPPLELQNSSLEIRPYVAGFWKLVKIYFGIPARTPGILQIGRGRRPRTPKISPNGHKKRLIFEAGVRDRLATLRVSSAKN